MHPMSEAHREVRVVYLSLFMPAVLAGTSGGVCALPKAGGLRTMLCQMNGRVIRKLAAGLGRDKWQLFNADIVGSRHADASVL